MTDRDMDAGRGALRGALPPIDTPAALEDHVRASLGARGLVTTRTRRWTRWATPVGLIAAGFLVGFLVRGARANRPADVDGRAGRYALLLYGVPAEDTGVVHATRAREYGQWASNLDGGARWVGGHELAGVVETLGAPPTGVPAPHDRMAGFFIIEATSAEQATEVARTCPHLKYGGRVVVMVVAT